MEAQVDIVVMAHPSRGLWACWLADDVGARIVWDERDDEWDTGRRAWEAIDRSAAWGVVLQDDALPVGDFRRHATDALAAAPASCVSFYTGTGKPHAPATTLAAERAQRLGASWLEADRLYWGVAVAMPTEHIDHMLRWRVLEGLPYDQRISRFYLRHRQTRVRYTWPSLCDHRDGASLVARSVSPRPSVIERHAHRVGVPVSWQGPVVAF